VETFLHIPADMHEEREHLKFGIPVLEKQKSSFVFAKPENPDLY